MNQPGNHGMLQPNQQQQNATTLIYTDNGNQHGTDPGGLMISRNVNVVQNQMSIPPSSWGKCPSQSSQGNIGNNNGMMTSGDIHHSSASISPSTSSNSFGASSPFNPYQSDPQQQHCFYPNSVQTQMEMRYNSSNANTGTNNGMTGGNQLRSNTTGYPHGDLNNSASGFYDTDERDCRQYYPQMDQHHQGASFPYDQPSTMKSNGSSCAMMSGHTGGNNNFYSYYNNQNSQYSQHGIYNSNQLNSGTSDETEFADRTHHSNANRYFEQNPHSSNRQDPSSQGYFNPSNYGTTSQCGRYNNSSSSPYSSQNHGHHPPFRRKSMESYISEPGDMRYNSKYGCPNFSAPPQSQSPSQYCSPAPSPSSTMIKRECMSNPSSSIPTPPMSAITVNNCTGWTRNTNSEDIQMQSDPGQHSQDYIYTNPNSNSHQNQSGSSNMNMNYNNIPYNQTGNETNDSFHHQQMASFKSCIFEQQNEKVDNSELKNVNNVGFGVKAASVKHRSLSLSVPLSSSLSSSYPRNDIITLSQPGSFTGHEHPNSNDSTSGDYTSSQKVSESVSTYSLKTNSPHEQFPDNYADTPLEEMEESVSEFISKSEECRVSSCNEKSESVHHQGEAFTSESTEKAEDSEVGGCGESIGESNCGSVGSLELCPSTSDHCDEEISNPQTSLLDSSPFGELPDTDTEMVASEPPFDPNDKPPPDDPKLDNPAASNVISTTTNEMSSSGGGGNNECDPDSECNSSNNSNCSFSSALFGKRANSISCNFSSDENDNDESCTSGGSFTFGESHHSTRGTRMSPQKIAKRSFSETDKDMIVNTTAISFGIQKNGGGVVVPKGWKREVSYSNEDNPVIVYYVSPSDTKLRSWDELKNYICSDGTCKCGLSCPLRLESAFSFDPKVISLCVDKEEDLVYLNESEELAQHQHQTSKSSLCNHYKRKIPKAEDSPLISSTTSTRDDLGDCPEKRSKKRRTSESEFSTGNPGNATPNSKESPLPSSVSRHVAVPCSQQSPDTTTQTPQTGMSPASSVSSEPSSGTGFNSTIGTRSLTTTPTPPSSSVKVSTPPANKRQQGHCDFGWPPPPTTTQSSSLTSPNNNNISWTSPSGTSTSPSTSSPLKKSSCHHLIPKGNKRANSPCPNIDVRQIPPEQNRPPPKPGIESSIETLSPATTVTPSQPTFNANFSFFPVTSTANEMTNLSMNLNSGFTISPIVQTNTGNTMTVFSTPQISQALPSTNMSCTIPLEIQKIINPGIPDQTNAFIPQFQHPVVLSVVGQPQQIEVRPDNTKESNPGDTSKVVDSAVEKSPLQLVQDVVNRFESKADGESLTEDSSMENEKRLQISTEPEKSTAGSDKAEQPKSEISDGQSSTGSTGSKSDSSTTPVVVVDGTNCTTLPVQDLLNKAACGNPNSRAEDKSKPDPKIDAGTAVVNTTTVSIASMDHSTVTVPTCITSMGNTISTFTVPTSTTQQIILQAPQTSDVQTAGGNFLTTAGQQTARYPIIQTIQPFFLNQAGGTGGPFIISPQSQTHQTDPLTQQSFIYHDPQISHQQHNPGDHGLQSMLHPTTTMLFDPSMCANNPNFGGGVPGAKKKKKRLSKKQQQQQAQLQLQQQLLLQQIHQAQQQQAAAAYTIFPQSFNLGPQGFSLQPMNFFQTPTFLTLPNLILNPADGTLFLQPSGPLSTTATPVQNTVKFPLTTTTTLTPSQPQQIQQHPNPLAPKKDGTILINAGGTTGQILEVGKAPSDAGSDDSRRNPTPDSSTGDIQLGILNASNTNQQPGNTIISIAPHPTTTTILPTANKKVLTKSRAVSSSSTVKRIFPQKQILPKIDSTTPSIDNN